MIRENATPCEPRQAPVWQCCFASDVSPANRYRGEMKSRRDGSAAFLGDDPAALGAMVPMVVSADQLVGHLLLFG
jgi:hypothetical protein